MALNDRIAIIIEENHLKQSEMADLMGVTGSYVSTLLSGRSKSISKTLAYLLEEKLGYSAQWVLSGAGTKYKDKNKIYTMTPERRQAALKLEQMPEGRVAAVLAFMCALERGGERKPLLNR